MADKEHPWMYIADALLGESEIAGARDNPKILELFRISGTPFEHDEVAWCAGAVNGVLLCSGYAGTRSALASSFANFGADLGRHPQYGCIVLFYPLTAGASGHVSFFLKKEGGRVLCRGGNQSNKFTDTWFEESKVRRYCLPTVKAQIPQTTLPTILTLAPQHAPDWVRGATAPAIVPATVSKQNNFDRIYPIIAKWEGSEYTNDPQDDGGPTRWGITQARLSEARGYQVSAEEVRSLTEEEAIPIYKKYYYDVIRGDELPISVAIMTYNTAVNSGPARGAKFLQICLNKQGFGLDEDGEIGPLTITAAAKCNRTRLVQDYSAHYEAFYRGLKNFPRFGKGWLNRLADVTSKAAAVVGEGIIIKEPIMPEVPTVQDRVTFDLKATLAAIRQLRETYEALKDMFGDIKELRAKPPATPTEPGEIEPEALPPVPKKGLFGIIQEFFQPATATAATGGIGLVLHQVLQGLGMMGSGTATSTILGTVASGLLGAGVFGKFTTAINVLGIVARGLGKIK